MKNNISRFVLVAMTAQSFKMGWGALFYYLILILMTDALVWLISGELARIDAGSMIRYSLLSYPAWMLLALKGIGREQTELRDQGHWHAIDLLPGGATFTFLSHHVGQAFRMPAVRVWMICYSAIALFQGAPVISLMLALGCLLIGSLNIVASGLLLKMWSPKGYGSVLSSLLYSLTWILSGAAFPMSALNLDPIVTLLNPFSAAISFPLSLVLSKEMQTSLPDLCLILLASIGWCGLFLVLCRSSERIRREALHV